MKKTALQLITLVSFISLIGLFVSHRAGYWQMNEHLLQLSPNGGALPVSKSDTLAKSDSSSQAPLVIPSSKVIILTSPQKQRDLLDKAIKKEDSAKSAPIPIMGGSKSAPVFLPALVPDTTLTVPDSTKSNSDTLPAKTPNRK